MREKDINIKIIDKENIKEISRNNFNTYLDLNINMIYNLRSKRFFAFSRKILLNKK